jgi:hypothetical protein
MPTRRTRHAHRGLRCLVRRLLSRQAALAIAGYLMSEEIVKAIITGIVGPVIVALINQRRDSRATSERVPLPDRLEMFSLTRMPPML